MVIDIVPGRNAGLGFEFLLELGQGQAAEAGQFFQGQFRAQMFSDIGGRPLDIRSKQPVAVGYGHDLMQGMEQAGGGKITVLIVTCQFESFPDMLQKAGIAGPERMCRQSRQAVCQMPPGRLLQKEQVTGIGDVQLEPVDFACGQRDQVRTVHFVGSGDENIIAGQFVVLLICGKVDGALGDEGKFIGIAVKMRGQRRTGMVHGVLSEHTQSRNA